MKARMHGCFMRECFNFKCKPGQTMKARMQGCFMRGCFYFKMLTWTNYEDKDAWVLHARMLLL